MSLHCIGFLFSGHGFGINTDIFETNVINLAVVIGVVITVVGDALRELLGNRKTTIVDNLSAADNREQEFENQMNQVKNQVTTAYEKASEIRQQGFESAEREKEMGVAKANDEATRLTELKDDSLRLHQQEAAQQIGQQIIVLSVDEAEKELEQRMEEPMFDFWVMEKKLTYYDTIQDYAPLLV